MLFWFALVNVPVCIIMIFVPKKILTLPCLAVFWLFWYAASASFESDAFVPSILGTIDHTHNPFLIAYVVLLASCALLSILYLLMSLGSLLTQGIKLTKFPKN